MDFLGSRYRTRRRLYMIERIIREEERKNEEPFITKAIIESGQKRIEVPIGARFYRLEGGEIKFFKFVPSGSKNHFEELPEGVKEISFPSYEQHRYNIEYGEPEFY